MPSPYSRPMTSPLISKSSGQPALSPTALVRPLHFARGEVGLAGGMRWPGHTVGNWLSLGHNPGLLPLCLLPICYIFPSVLASISGSKCTHRENPKTSSEPHCLRHPCVHILPSQRHSELCRNRDGHVTCFHTLPCAKDTAGVQLILVRWKRKLDINALNKYLSANSCARHGGRQGSAKTSERLSLPSRSPLLSNKSKAVRQVLSWGLSEEGQLI